MLAVHRTEQEMEWNQRRTGKIHPFQQKPKIEHYVSFIIVSRTAATRPDEDEHEEKQRNKKKGERATHSHKITAKQQQINIHDNDGGVVTSR